MKNKPAASSAGRKLWPILAAVAGVAVLVVGILIFVKIRPFQSGETTVTTVTTTAPPSTVPLEGMSRADLEKRFGALNEMLRTTATCWIPGTI